MITPALARELVSLGREAADEGFDTAPLVDAGDVKSWRLRQMIVEEAFRKQKLRKQQAEPMRAAA